MILLDENILENQRQVLRNWRIRCRQIGQELGQAGMKDENILPLLHRIGPVTFFTRDLGFYHRRLCHDSYCLACLEVGQYEVASFIRKFLHHAGFNTMAKRRGKIVRLTHLGIRYYQLHSTTEYSLEW